MKLVVEPPGCLATAVVPEGLPPIPGRRVGIIVSGGNVDLQDYAQLQSGLKPATNWGSASVGPGSVPGPGR